MRLCEIAVAILAAQLLLSGCSGVHLYNAGRDQQGTQAKTAWSEVDLAATIATERTNLQKLLAAEQRTQERLAAAIRDNHLRSLVSSEPLSKTLLESVKRRLNALTGDDAGVLSGVATAKATIAQTRRALENARETLAIEVGKSASCDSLKGADLPQDLTSAIAKKPEAQRPLAEGAVAELKKQCAQLAAAERALASAFSGGNIGAASRQWRDDVRQIEDAELATENAKREYRDAKAAYEAALGATASGSSMKEKVEGALTKVAEAADKLQKLQSGLGKQFIAQERLDSLDQVLKVLAGSEGADQVADDALRKSLASLAALPHLADEGRALLDKSRRARTTPFVIETEHQRLLLDSGTREVEARKRTALLAQQVFAALLEEAMQLAKVQADLDSVPAVHAQPFDKALDGGDQEQKRFLYSIAGRYLDAIGRLQARAYKLEYERIASIHEAALTRSEIALLMWNNVIGASVEQVAGYHASGIRPEVIVQALQAAGVVWIGHGVNR